MVPTNNAGAFAGWQAMGSWTVPSTGSLLPTNVSVSPAAGTGASQTFTFVYSDPYGYADINWVGMLFQSTLYGANACFLEYTRATNIIQLVNDTGGGFAGSAALGSAGTLSNSQCTLNLATSLAS